MNRRLRTTSRRLSLAVLALVTAACGDATSPSPNPAPQITSVTPTIVNEGTGDFVLTVNGSAFISASSVRWNGDDRPTTRVSSTQVTAAIAAADVAQDGLVEVTVFNPAPGGGSSNAVTVEIAPQANPQPTLASMAPSTLVAGASDATLTLTGTGFVPESKVMLGISEKTPTYVSSSELSVTLSAADLAAARIVDVTVVNAAPGGGTSAARTLTVNAPIPTVASLNPAQTTAGQDSFVVHVIGTGFIGNSVVHFEGSARATRWISATELVATLPAGDLSLAGGYALSVVNPTPGGGTSGQATLTLVNATPTLDELPSRGATAGGGAFTLTVHGSDFVETSLVRWNGADRPTTYLGPRRLSANISAADVASIGSADVTVFNPAPGGGTSGAIAMTIRTFAAPSITASIELDLPSNDIAYDAASDRLYASIPSTVATLGNSVVAIDPATGVVTDTVFVGSEPRRLALSDDGSILWVELDGSGEVRPIDLATLTPGAPFSLDGFRVDEMRVMPGQSGTLAIALRNTCCSPRHEGVAIYDSGVRRAQMTPGHTGSNSIVFGGDASVLYGNNAETSEDGFRTMAVTPAGVVVTDTTFGLIDEAYPWIEYGSGRVYSTTSEVVDPLRQVRVGEFATGGTAVLPDAGLGRAYFVDDTGTVSAYDLNTFQFLGSVALAGVSFGHPAGIRVRLVRWDTDGLAFRDAGRIYMFRTTIASP
ncbi:MAG: YncE family protein [Longimicrobiales bacterium]